MINNGRFDGHIVQGHVDTTATITSITEEGGSWIFSFDYTPDAGHVMVEKGSVTVNGISLTCFGIGDHSFQVAIIPYTFEHTTLGRLKKGDVVNIEFDIVGKYVQRILSKQSS